MRLPTERFTTTIQVLKCFNKFIELSLHTGVARLSFQSYSSFNRVQNCVD